MIQAAWGRSDGGRAAIGYQKDPAAPHLAGHRGEQKVGRFVTAITLSRAAKTNTLVETGRRQRLLREDAS